MKLLFSLIFFLILLLLFFLLSFLLFWLKKKREFFLWKVNDKEGTSSLKRTPPSQSKAELGSTKIIVVPTSKFVDL